MSEQSEVIASGRQASLTATAHELTWEVRVERLSATNSTRIPVLYLNGKLAARFTYANADQVASALREAVARGITG